MIDENTLYVGGSYHQLPYNGPPLTEQELLEARGIMMATSLGHEPNFAQKLLDIGQRPLTATTPTS